MVNLGGDYFLDCTKDESLCIAKRRRERIIDSYIDMQTNLDKLSKIK
jgi:prefoldin subunit 5